MKNKKDLLKDVFSEIANQANNWRELARSSRQFFDGVQLSAEEEALLDDFDKPNFIHNLIRPAINSVLGHERQARVDIQVLEDDRDSHEVAEGLNEKLHEALRLADANELFSRAFEAQILDGLGVLHVRKGHDPLKPQYLVDLVDLDDFEFDMRSLRGGHYDADKCRWMARRIWLDLDEAREFLPDYTHKYLDGIASGWDVSQFELGDETSYRDFEYYKSRWTRYCANSRHAQLIRRVYKDTEEVKQIALYEVYYKDPTTVYEVHFDNGLVERLTDKAQLNNPRYLSNPAIKAIIKARRKVMRRKLYLGPYEIFDGKSPQPHGDFPFVLFIGFVEKANSAPYGLVRDMIPPQQEYNSIGIEMLTILRRRTVIIEEDALTEELSHKEIMRKAHSRSTVWSIKTGKQAPVIRQDFTELQALHQLRVQAENKIRDVAGIYANYSGQVMGEQSGKAIQSLASLSSTGQASVVARYSWAKRRVAELVLALIVDEIREAPVSISITTTKERDNRVVHLNQTSEQGGVSNSLLLAKYRVALGDVPSTATYKQQQHDRWMNAIVAFPPQVQEVALPYIAQLSDIPDKDQFIEDLKGKLGIGGTSEQRDALTQQQLQIQQAKQAMDLEEQKARIDKLKAEAAAQLALKEERESEAVKQLREAALADSKIGIEADQRIADKFNQAGRRLAEDIGLN